MKSRLLIVACLLAAFGIFMHLYPLHVAVPPKKQLSELPLEINGWRGRVSYLDAAVLNSLRVSDYLERVYVRDGLPVSVYIGYYASQGEGAQIHSPKHCLPGSGWLKLGEEVRTIALGERQNIRFVEATYQKEGGKDLFLYWYKMKDVCLTNEYLLKLQMIAHSLLYQRNDAAFIRLVAPVGEDHGLARETLEAFMQDFVPLLSDYLPE